MTKPLPLVFHQQLKNWSCFKFAQDTRTLEHSFFWWSQKKLADERLMGQVPARVPWLVIADTIKMLPASRSGLPPGTRKRTWFFPTSVQNHLSRGERYYVTHCQRSYANVAIASCFRVPAAPSNIIASFRQKVNNIVKYRLIYNAQ